MCLYPGFLPASRVPLYQPQLPPTEMASRIHGNQPWKSHDEVMTNVREEQARLQPMQGR